LWVTLLTLSLRLWKKFVISESDLIPSNHQTGSTVLQSLLALSWRLWKNIFLDSLVNLSAPIWATLLGTLEKLNTLWWLVIFVIFEHLWNFKSFISVSFWFKVKKKWYDILFVFWILTIDFYWLSINVLCKSLSVFLFFTWVIFQEVNCTFLIEIKISLVLKIIWFVVPAKICGPYNFILVSWPLKLKHRTSENPYMIKCKSQVVLHTEIFNFCLKYVIVNKQFLKNCLIKTTVSYFTITWVWCSIAVVMLIFIAS